MLDRLRSWWGSGSGSAPPESEQEKAPMEVLIEGLPALQFAGCLHHHAGFPWVDWERVWHWHDGAADGLKDAAWLACEKAWLLHLRDALGMTFRLRTSDHVMLLSSLTPRLSQVTLAYMERTLKSIRHILGDIALPQDGQKDVLIVFDDKDTYYRYVTQYYPENSEFAFSSGMFLSDGCAHYVTVKEDLRAIEPVIAHEMTHGQVAHLPLPAWLNEGIAVNVESQIAGGSGREPPQKMHARHQAFWNERSIQHFWSGEAFHRNDESELAYDLARIMVVQMGRDWPLFTRFALAAHWQDAGEAAAHEHWGGGLGTYVCALLECAPTPGWSPMPAQWTKNN